MAKSIAVLCVIGAFLVSSTFSYYLPGSGGWGYSTGGYTGAGWGNGGGWGNSYGGSGWGSSYGSGWGSSSYGSGWGKNYGASVNTDIGNRGGQHQNIYEIGGVQNLSGRPLEIPRSTSDANNVGGTHQNIQRIGGILQF